MIHVDFAFEYGQSVLARDYDTVRRQHPGIVVRRWVEERPKYDPEQPGELAIHYAVLLQDAQGKPFQEGRFLEEDLAKRD